VGVFVPQHIARVDIVGPTAGTNSTGLWTQNTTVDDVTVALPTTGSATGVYRPNGQLTANNLTVSAGNGISGSGQDEVYRNVRVRAGQSGIDIDASFTFTLENAQIKITGAGTALRVSSIFGHPLDATVRFAATVTARTARGWTWGRSSTSLPRRPVPDRGRDPI
jgi:hypothetical protein